MAKGSIFVHVNVNIWIIWIFVFQARDVPRCYFWKKKYGEESKFNFRTCFWGATNMDDDEMKLFLAIPEKCLPKKKTVSIVISNLLWESSCLLFLEFLPFREKAKFRRPVFRCFISYNSVRYQKLSFRFLQYRTTIHNRLFPSSQLSPHTNIVSSQIPT